MRSDVPIAVKPTQQPLSRQGDGDEWDDEPEVIWGLQREMWECPIVLEICVEGDPKSKARPRLGRNGATYTPKETVDAETRLAVLVRNQMLGRRPLAAPASFGVLAVFFTANRQRRDVDNMLKLVLDAITKAGQMGHGLWVDDCQVSEVSARLIRNVGDEEARTHIRVYETLTKGPPTRLCDQCGTAFLSYDSLSSRRFCNRACGYEWRKAQNKRTCLHCGGNFQSNRKDVQYCGNACKSLHLTERVACDQCGFEYRKPQSLIKPKNHCSPECQAVAARERRRGIPKGICVDCGGPVSRKEYQRCQACSFLAKAKR